MVEKCIKLKMDKFQNNETSRREDDNDRKIPIYFRMNYGTIIIQR